MNINGTINNYSFQYGNYNAQTFMNGFTTLTGLMIFLILLQIHLH